MVETKLILSVARIVMLSQLLFSLGSCSVKLAYNNIDWLYSYWVDDFISLNRSQSTALDACIGKTLVWHRRAELPAYSRLIAQVKRDVETGLTRADLRLHFQALDAHWGLLLGRLMPCLAGTLQAITADQETELFAAFARRNRKFEKRHLLTPELNRRRQLEARMLKEVGNWLGEVSPSQALRVKRAAARISPPDEVSLRQRINWQTALRVILKQPPVAEGLEPRLRKLYLHPAATYPPGYAERLQRDRKALVEMIVAITALNTPDQQQYLISRLDDVQHLVEDLANERADEGSK